MRTIALLSRKGGSGKTTLSIALAVQAALEGETCAALDLDPQASMMSWSDLREEESPAVIATPAARLDKVLTGAEKQGVSLAVLDTMPHAESSILKAARLADFALVPVRPSLLDLVSIEQTLEICRLAKLRSVVVINAVKSKSLLVEAKNAIAKMDCELCPVPLWDRTDYPRSLAAGLSPVEYEPQGKASNEIQRLYKWLCTYINV